MLRAFYKHFVPNGTRKLLTRTKKLVTRALPREQQLDDSFPRINWKRNAHLLNATRNGQVINGRRTQLINFRRHAQLLVVVICAAAVKLYYSTATVNHLRWILAPTTALIEFVSGHKFEFESQAGYISSDRSFVIAASCAGVNFLITAFLMLALRKLGIARRQDRAPVASRKLSWSFIPVAALFAYLATLVANTVRISTALRLHETPPQLSWLSPGQLHRVEGIVIYFGFLLLVFLLSERASSENSPTTERVSLFRRSLFPLLIYYGTTLGIPLANGAFRHGVAATEFWEHSLFVLLTPLLLILPLAIFRFSQHLSAKGAKCNSLGHGPRSRQTNCWER